MSEGELGNTLLPGLEPALVEQWILDLDLGAQGPLTLVRAGNGMSNLTCLVTDAAGSRPKSTGEPARRSGRWRAI